MTDTTLKAKEPREYLFDWDGACKPSGSAYAYISRTFSIGIFQWIPAKGGGLKKSKVLKRIKGYSSEPQKVYDEAERTCAHYQQAFGFKPHPAL